MQDIIGWLFSSSGFMPHGHCYLWQPGTLWLNVGSDGLIASAYYAIPVGLYYLVRERRTEIPYPGILLMFAAFIFLCGSTHVMEIWTVWHPDYRQAGLLKALTGIISVATMLALFRIMPQALQLRSPLQLQTEVQSRTAELARVNEQLRRQIVARDLAQAQLRAQDQRKDEFLATLAHELRNPLAPIRHAVKVLGADNAQPEQKRWGREVIDRQAHRMALLLDDLLDVSRITRGRLALKLENVRLSAVITSAVETVRPAIEDKAHRLSVIQPDEPIEITADPLRLSQAISNLLTNAAKFTPHGGRITLAAARTGANLSITVTDSGIGFDPAAAPMLFEMFSQANAAAEASEGGLGIGLSLVRGLVQLHGGTVGARSPGKGLGAEFTITLPATMLSPAASPANLAPVGSAIPAAPSTQARVLIADDNRDAADSIGLLLQLEGHEVFVAHSGNEAIALGRLHRPDVVILDIGMPDIDGYEVARLARREPWGKHAYLVALTGWGQSDDKQSARAAGFDRHLTKPAAPDVVSELIAAFISSGREGISAATPH
jgi:signal transduction histidine kinase/ActR/RegA family two-component response regulator